MVEIKEKSKCCGCHACYNVCPARAIEMVKDENGFDYPKINRQKCLECNLCENVCPVLNKISIDNHPISYACYNKNEEIRLNSSSGGVFSLLAEYIMSEKGIVYGASFDGDWKVNHIRIEDKNQLNKLRTSKYVQSKIGDTYQQAKNDLNNGKKVLFTGTPCQIEGFLNFLGKEYDNLYTQDIICHGVPSQKVWEKYLEYREKLDKNHPMRINFRQKDDGWNLYALLLQYNNSAYKTNHDDDLFMQAFLRNACLRDSCYNCSSKSKNRRSDVTLADFWGIDNIAPGLNDNKGTSLVILNTDKGEEMFENIKDYMVWRKVDFEESIKYNPSMFKSVEMPKYRDEFFSNIEKMEFDNLVKKYTVKIGKRNIFVRIINKMKRLLKKLFTFK